VTLAPDLAADARSVLACPASVRIDVAGVVHGLQDLAIDVTDGVPVLVAPAASGLSRAARAREHAEITVASGLGRPGDPARQQGLTLAGTLTPRATEACECCGELRAVVAVDLDTVVLTWWNLGLPVPRDRFLSRHHDLNRGYLQRTVEHANSSHEQELRESVATAARCTPDDLLAVSLDELSTRGFVLVWLDADGAHRRPLTFRRPVTTPVELGEALHDQLHAGIR
jgi:hypothetical protein